MIAAGPPGQPPPADLTARVFRALYPGYDLHDLAGTWLALPAGTPWLPRHHRHLHRDGRPVRPGCIGYQKPDMSTTHR
jgi:hypothetical protein